MLCSSLKRLIKRRFYNYPFNCFTTQFLSSHTSSNSGYQDNRDLLWFTKLTQNLHPVLGLSLPSNASPRAIYNQVINRCLNRDLASLDFNQIVEVLIFLGVSSQRKFHFVFAQKTFLKIWDFFLKTHLTTLENRCNAPIVSKIDPFMRKLLPNMILSMSNLRVLDSVLVLEFEKFLKKHKNTLYREYFYSLNTVMALFWAVSSFGKKEFEALEANLNEYMWIHRNKLDPMGVMRLVWLNSFEIKGLKTELLREMKEKIQRVSNFAYNYKNSMNFLQIFMNLYPEAARIFFENQDFNIIAALLKDNKFQPFFNGFYPMAKTCLTVSELNLSQPTVFLESFQREVNSFLFIKENIPNTGKNLERRISAYLDDMGYKHQRNIRMGIYEVDIFMPELNLVLEVNGEAHLIYEVHNQQFKTRSKKLDYKERHLRLWGVERVATVELGEWRKVESDIERCKAYLKTIIEGNSTQT